MEVLIKKLKNDCCKRRLFKGATLCGYLQKMHNICVMKITPFLFLLIDLETPYNLSRCLHLNFLYVY